MFSMEFLDQTPTIAALIHQKSIIKSYYKRLCASAPGQKTFETLQQIMKDEDRHYGVLCNLYKKIADSHMGEQNEKEDLNLLLFPDTLQRVIAEEITALELYKNAYITFKKSEMKDQIFAIILDEIRHCMLLNLIHSELK